MLTIRLDREVYASRGVGLDAHTGMVFVVAVAADAHL